MGSHLWDLKKRKERTQLVKISAETLKKEKKNPQVLIILKFRGNKIDQDCKIVKGN